MSDYYEQNVEPMMSPKEFGEQLEALVAEAEPAVTLVDETGAPLPDQEAARNTVAAPKLSRQQRRHAERQAFKDQKKAHHYANEKVSRAELFGYLRQADSSFKQMAEAVAKLNNIIAFLGEKAGVDLVQFNAWEKEQLEKLEAAEKAAKEEPWPTTSTDPDAATNSQPVEAKQPSPSEE